MKFIISICVWLSPLLCCAQTIQHKDQPAVQNPVLDDPAPMPHDDSLRMAYTLEQRAKFPYAQDSTLDMRVWGIAAQNDSLFQYLTDKFKVINESDSVFHEDVNNLMILYYGYAYRDSYGHMPVTEIKINQLLQQGKTEDAFDLCEKTLEQAPASPHILILAANLAQKLGTKSSKELDSYYARFFTCLSAMHWLGIGSAEVPFIVVNVSDEYAFLYSILKIQGIESQELIHREDGTPCDRIVLREDDARRTGLTEVWFDITYPMRGLAKIYETNSPARQKSKPKIRNKKRHLSNNNNTAQ